MRMKRKIGTMENKTKDTKKVIFDGKINSEILKFVFVSVLFFLGFAVLYFSGVSLNSITLLQANFIESIILGVQEHSIFEVFISTFSGILIAISSFIIFCLGLSFLAVKNLDKLKYFLIVPILCSGILFNFSILFLFFGIGLFISSLYIIPLGETYKLELKKWKKFRVGNNAVSKALFVLFLFIFLGSLISFSVNDSYQQLFLNTTVSSISNIFNAEVTNFNANTDNSEITNKFVENQMIQIREQYPDLTEEEYLQMEIKIRQEMEKNGEMIEIGEMDLSSIISQGVENSLVLKAFLVWFPLIMSFVIWVFLEFLGKILFSPVSGGFSYLWFSFLKDN